MSDVYGSGGEGIEPEIVWCPVCGLHLPEGPNTLRVRADGIRRHIDCDTPVRTEEQHARDLVEQERQLTVLAEQHQQKIVPSSEVEMPAVTGLLNKLGVEGTAYRQPALTTGPQHFVTRAGNDYCCDCPIGFDHDAMGRATPVRGVEAHRLFAPDPEVQLIVDSLADEELCRHQRDARTCTQCPGLEFPRPVDQFRAPGASKIYDAARLAMRQALIADILSGTLTREKSPLYSEAEHLAENLLDSGWIPSTDRMAR